MSTDSLALEVGPLNAALRRHVQCGAVPGAIACVCRGSEMHVEVFGVAAVGGRTLQRDAIFRIASMTKPVVAAAALMLVEEGQLSLDEPLDAYLPELAHRRVLRQWASELDDTVPANRPISLRDLLTGTMGFGIALHPAGPTPLQRAEQALELRTLGPPKPATPLTADEWLRRLAALPLMHQPGEAWTYNTSSTVLGILIQRVASRSLQQFLHDVLFEPLGMRDTAFSVPPAKLQRLVACYQADPITGKLNLFDGIYDSQWSDPPALEDGAGGLVSTIDDYAAFAQMIRDRGQFRQQQLLSAPLVDAMTSNQLSPTTHTSAREFPGVGRGWGFGVSVVTAPDPISPTPGRFGWDGGFGTSWYCDRDWSMSAILLTQRLLFPTSSGIESDFWTQVYRLRDRPVSP